MLCSWLFLLFQPLRAQRNPKPDMLLPFVGNLFDSIQDQDIARLCEVAGSTTNSVKLIHSARKEALIMGMGQDWVPPLFSARDFSAAWQVETTSYA